jgi:hypothetical protein
MSAHLAGDVLLPSRWRSPLQLRGEEQHLSIASFLVA